MCHSCEVLTINGVLCHEIGCPDSYKDEKRSCKWCGADFKPETKDQDCCSHSCSVAYHNTGCDCEECARDNLEA
jgi:hypothetical protein